MCVMLLMCVLCLCCWAKSQSDLHVVLNGNSSAGCDTYFLFVNTIIRTNQIQATNDIHVVVRRLSFVARLQN